MARVVYTGVNGQSEVRGSLFESQKFWFSQKVPQRKWFIEQVEVSTGKLNTAPNYAICVSDFVLPKSNGGVVVPLEKQADIKLVDHTRQELAPDT